MEKILNGEEDATNIEVNDSSNLQSQVFNNLVASIAQVKQELQLN